MQDASFDLREDVCDEAKHGELFSKRLKNVVGKTEGKEIGD